MTAKKLPSAFFELLIKLSYEFEFPVENVVVLPNKGYCSKCWRSNRKLVRVIFLGGTHTRPPYSDGMTECCANRVECHEYRSSRQDKEAELALKHIKPLSTR